MKKVKKEESPSEWINARHEDLMSKQRDNVFETSMYCVAIVDYLEKLRQEGKI